MIKKTVLITGVSGHLGQELILPLIKKNYKVVGISRTPPVNFIDSKNNFTFERVDLTKKRQVSSLFKKYHFNCIVHLAAVVKTGDLNIDQLRAMFETNVIGTYNLVQSTIFQTETKFVYASSMTVYGLPKYLPVDEKHPTDPTDFYATTKLVSEEIIQHFAKEIGFNYLILRFPGIFSKNRKSGALYNFIKNAFAGKQIEITATSPTPWDVLWIEDAVAGLISGVVLNQKLDGIINVGYKDKCQLEQMAQKIKKITNSNSQIHKNFSFTNPEFCFANQKMIKNLKLKLPSLERRLRDYISYLESENDEN